MDNLIGIYEKALPESYDINEKLECTARLGFDFMELSIDESDDRLERLYYNSGQTEEIRNAIWASGIQIPTMCLSAHRKYPFGSRDPAVRSKALEIMDRAISLACDIGIRVIQLAGYDIYYEASGPDTRAYFMEGLREALKIAARKQIILAVEIMDTSFINSITRFMEVYNKIPSPWLAVYPDLGNLTAWGNDVEHELALGIDRIVGIHVKETLPVSPGFPGQFRDVPFGRGTVDFDLCFKTLKCLDYHGPFLIEMWNVKGSSPRDTEMTILEAKDFIVSKIKKAYHSCN
ncbi:MAG TPA: L-ribulose-5-phosphate 3-epimerase [Clostridiales bacterium]|nr:L-ribulose-5-phosphate 3-epimerase [Clostridiales bacterium]